jgi:hypothetical protein
MRWPLPVSPVELLVLAVMVTIIYAAVRLFVRMGNDVRAIRRKQDDRDDGN